MADSWLASGRSHLTPISLSNGQVRQKASLAHRRNPQYGLVPAARTFVEQHGGDPDDPRIPFYIGLDDSDSSGSGRHAGWSFARRSTVSAASKPRETRGSLGVLSPTSHEPGSPRRPEWNRPCDHRVKAAAAAEEGVSK
jgi:hypothetical protein